MTNFHLMMNANKSASRITVFILAFRPHSGLLARASIVSCSEQTGQNTSMDRINHGWCVQNILVLFSMLMYVCLCNICRLNLHLPMLVKILDPFSLTCKNPISFISYICNQSSKVQYTYLSLCDFPASHDH